MIDIDSSLDYDSFLASYQEECDTCSHRFTSQDCEHCPTNGEKLYVENALFVLDHPELYADDPY